MDGITFSTDMLGLIYSRTYFQIKIDHHFQISHNQSTYSRRSDFLLITTFDDHQIFTLSA